MQNTCIPFDAETDKFSNGYWAPKLICLQVEERPNDTVIFENARPSAVTGATNEALANATPERPLVGQNTAYDMKCLSAFDGDLLPDIFAAYERGAVQCTRTRERLLDIAKGNTGPRTKNRGYYSMDTILERRRIPFKVDKENLWRLRYAELDGVPLKDWPEEAITYAKDDPTATRLIYEAQMLEAKEMGYDAFEAEAARQAGFDFAFTLMHCWGVRTSKDRVLSLYKRTTKEMEALLPELQKRGLYKPDGKLNTTKLASLVQAALGEATPLTPTQKVKTTADVLERCKDETVNLHLKFKKLQKRKTTYILKLIEGIVGNIHANFHTLGADTGRTSSSGPNLQNQEKDGGVRECFVPREGFVFASADYDSQELRTLAEACLAIVGHSSLAARYQEDPNFDPHTDFAASMMGWTYEEAMERKEAGDKEVKEKRQQAKAANFGFPGGLGAEAFVEYAANSYGVHLTLEEAGALKNAWFAKWNEMTEYFAHVQRVTQGAGLQVQLRSGRWRGDVRFTSCANGYFQGLASEVTKTAAFFVAKECYSVPSSPLYGSRPVMIIHDELVVEAVKEKAHAAAMRLSELMVQAAKMWCPNVPASAPPTLSLCWSKNAEALYDENGQLIPWDLPEEEEEDAA